tara:strand:- start:612 stop:1226 length:615 start_codon:yes stop_codon:yes gene_type:complete
MQSTEKLSVVTTSDATIKKNLHSWFATATNEDVIAGGAWYADAQEFCRELGSTYRVDPYIVASVLSALSPNNKWDRNKIDTKNCIHAYKQGKKADSVSVCTYNANKEKAFRILYEGKQITAQSPKTHSFAMNCGYLSEDHITIDKWHIRACLCSPEDGIVPTVDSVTAKQYRRLEALTVDCSAGMIGYRYQATIWVAIKSAWGR